MIEPRATRIAIPLILVAALLGPTEASEPRLAVRLLPVDPVDVLAGSATLRAEVEAAPGATIADVSFYVNGALLASDAEPPYDAEWTIADRFRDHLIRVTVRAADGQTGHDVESVLPAGPMSTATVVERAPDWVEIQVAFTDPSGRPILDIEMDEVEVFEDGRRQQIELFEPDQRPATIILLLDGSDSTQSFWRLLGTATELFGRTLRAPDRASVAAFDKWIYQLAPLGTLNESISTAMDRHQDLGGSTRLYDAVAQSAVFLSARADAGRRTLILLTDGADSASDLRVQDVENYLQETGTEAHSILVYPQGDDSQTYQLYKHSRLDYLRKGMTRISQASGGVAFKVEPAELVETFLRIGEHLRSQYQVGYSSLSRRLDAAEREIDVRVRRRRVGQIHYRRAQSARTVTEFLISEMEHPKERRRQFAFGAAGALPNSDVQRGLVKALAAGDDLESGAPADARRTLLQLGTMAAPHLLDATASQDAVLRRRAATVLVDILAAHTGSGGDIFVLEEMVTSLGEGDLSAGTAALQGLTELDLSDAVRADLREVLAVLADE